MTKLKSGVSRELEGHFVLDEDGIRRIVGVFEAKSKDLAHPTSIVFHVEREDDRFYETTKVDDVVADANTPGHRITDLGIELRNADPNKPPQPWERDWIAAVHFKTKRGKQSIVIGAEDRNWALLLADELEPQVVRTFTPKKIPTLLLVGLYVATAIWLHTLLKLLPKFSFFDIVPVIRTAIWLGAGLLAIETIGSRGKFISSWAGPESSFHWGEQATSYAHSEGLRHNLFWVVIVGFIVSVAATAYTSTQLPQATASEVEKQAEKQPEVNAPNPTVNTDAAR